MDIDSGKVELSLNGETYTLVPTLKALQRIDRQFGSLRTAVERCGSMSLDAIVTVIAAGANLSKDEEKALPEQVFQEGIANVAASSAEYLTTLLNPSGKIGDGEGKA